MKPHAAPRESGRADAVVARAVTAGRWSFVIFGVAGSSWAVRIPQIRDRLSLDPSDVGFVLLSMALGAVGSMFVAGRLVRRFGPARIVVAAAGLTSCGLAVLSAGVAGRSVLVVSAGLLLIGGGMGPWDVAINVHAGSAEHRVRRSLLPRFHAWFSLGTVAGALIGSLVVRLGITVPVHLAALAVLVAAVMPLVVRAFLPAERRQDAHPSSQQDSVRAWRDPRIVLIGLVVLTATFSEGAGNDWAGLATVDGHHLSGSLGALALATVLTATTLVRWYAPALIDSRGRSATLRMFSAGGAVGVLVFVFAPWAPLAFLGLGMWGAGLALGFPIGMSAASDDPAHAAHRVAVVAAVGYVGFIIGPVAIGLLGDRFGVLRGLVAVAVMLMLGAILSGVVKSSADRQRSARRTT